MSDRRLLRISEIAINAPVFAVPTRENVPRGPKLDLLPKDGVLMRATDYVIGCVKRGSIQCFAPELSEKPTPPEPTPEPPAPAEPGRE